MESNNTHATDIADTKRGLYELRIGRLHELADELNVLLNDTIQRYGSDIEDVNELACLIEAKRCHVNLMAIRFGEKQRLRPLPRDASVTLGDAYQSAELASYVLRCLSKNLSDPQHLDACKQATDALFRAATAFDWLAQKFGGHQQISTLTGDQQTKPDRPEGTTQSGGEGGGPINLEVAVAELLADVRERRKQAGLSA